MPAARPGHLPPAIQQSGVNFTSLRTLQDTLIAQITTWMKSSAHPGTSDTNTILVLDAPDLLLAATPDPGITSSPSSPQSTTALEMMRLCLSLRSIPSIQNMVVSMSADSPLLHHPASATPLEIQHRTFLLSLAQSSRIALQLRPLGSGSAKDVSGVIRVNRGGAWDEAGEEEDNDGQVTYPQNIEAEPEGEWLYHISGNGEAKVWGRGEAGTG